MCILYNDDDRLQTTPNTFNIHKTQNILKCYVGRNSKQNQQKYAHICMDHSRHNRIEEAKAKCVHKSNLIATTFSQGMHP